MSGQTNETRFVTSFDLKIKFEEMKNYFGKFDWISVLADGFTKRKTFHSYFSLIDLCNKKKNV